MAVSTDYLNTGSYIKNYSSSNSDFLSRISTITFYDILDTSLNDVYNTLMNKISNITVTPSVVIDGSLMSIDKVLESLDTSIAKNTQDIHDLSIR